MSIDLSFDIDTCWNNAHRKAEQKRKKEKREEKKYVSDRAYTRPRPQREEKGPGLLQIILGHFVIPMIHNWAMDNSDDLQRAINQSLNEPSRKKPTSKGQSLVIVDEKKRNAKNGNDPCIICAEMKGVYVETPCCKQVFHKECALKCLSVKNQCPFCRCVIK